MASKAEGRRAVLIIEPASASRSMIQQQLDIAGLNGLFVDSAEKALALEN